MRTRTFLLVALLCCSAVCEASKPTLIMSLRASSKTVTQLREHFGKDYSIVDLPVNVPPQTISEGAPTQPVYVGGQCVAGRALLYFVVRADGTVASPYVAYSHGDGPFEDLATHQITAWRFQPAIRNGRPVAILWENYVHFYCPVQLPAIAGLWQLDEQSVWVELAQNGSAFQCRIDPAGVLMMSKGHFQEPYWIVWDMYWGTFGITHTDAKLLTTIPNGLDYDWRRTQAPMAPECVRAEHSDKRWMGP